MWFTPFQSRAIFQTWTAKRQSKAICERSSWIELQLTHFVGHWPLYLVDIFESVNNPHIDPPSKWEVSVHLWRNFHPPSKYPTKSPDDANEKCQLTRQQTTCTHYEHNTYRFSLISTSNKIWDRFLTKIKLRRKFATTFGSKS